MKKVTKNQIIDILERVAAILELKDANVFKIRAFENAARVLEGSPLDLPELVETGELEKLKGIGKGSIAFMIHEFYETGKSKDYDSLNKGIPETLFEMLEIPGLGAKRVKVLYSKLKIKTVEELERACQENRLLKLEGFGAKSQEKILKGISHFRKSAGSFLLYFAQEESKKIVEYLKKQKGILRIEVAGSLRRHKEVVKDMDILVSAKDPEKIHSAFVHYPSVVNIVGQGETKSSVTLRNGINCDLRTVTEEEFPYALYYFTGSKEHNVAVRTIAKKKGIKINEYGLFKGKRLIRCKDEAEIFEAVGLHYVPPEARENTGEVEWVMKKEFPKLVEEKDIRGVFHVHSTYSDGVAPLEEMVEKAEAMGLEYVGISDHSQSAGYANGLKADRLRQQWKELDQLQKKFKIRIFRGIESDILQDGSLDYPESILKEFDFIIGSIHSRFNMPEKEMTSRLERAMENPHMTFWGHPTGRLLLSRDSYAVHMDKLLDTAKENGVVVEINCQPDRMELDWRVCQSAKKKGILLSVNPDAHSVKGMEGLDLGIGIARKGWLEKKDVINTLPVSEMEKFLRKRK